MSLEEFQNLGKTILGLNDSNQIPYGVGFQDVKEIIKLVENNEYKDENLDVTLGIVASIPIYLLENVNKIQKQDIDALIHCFIQNFEKFTNKLVIQHIYEAFTIVSHSTKSSLSIILEYIRSENNKNNILKMFLLLAYIDGISIQSAEDSTIFIHIIMDNFQYATLAQQTQLITQLCSFALSLENFECHRQLIDFIFGYIITMINNEPKFISDIVYTFSKILLSLEMTIPELKFYVPDCLTQYLNSLADLSLEDRLKVIPNLAISFTLMNPDIYKDLLTNIVSDFSQIENYLPDSHFADHINSSQFYEDQLAAIWDILRPLLDDSKLASSAAFFSAVFCDVLSSLSETVPSFISSRLSTLLMFENTNKPMIILAFGLISDHIDPLMLEKEYISNIFAASQTSVEAFKATKKTLKVLMNHDKIDGSKIVEEIDNLGEFNLDFTKDIFSILEYLIFVSDKVAVTKASRLVLSYIQNENSPPIVKMHAIGLLPIFLKSECPDIFVNLVMIGVNKTFEIIQQEITPEITPLLRFIACGFVNNKITDVETFILPLNQTFLDICVCEDEKSSIIAMESLSMICEKDKSLDFP